MIKKLCATLFFASLLISCTEDVGRLAPIPLPGAEEKQSFDNVKLNFNPQVDILFVVDSSGSMSSHQRNLSQNIKLFTDNLSDLDLIDYHIGVTTTDMRYRSGHLHGHTLFVDKNTPNGDNVLSSNILVGTSGEATESVFEPVYNALMPSVSQGHNAGFYRDDAYFATIFITDAVDQSKLSAVQLFNYVSNLKGGIDEKILAYGVIVPSTVSNCDRDDGYSKPQKIEEYIDMVGGSYFSLCDPDFGSRLSGIGKNLVERIQLFVPFEVLPVVDTIKVMYGNYEIPNDPYVGWFYDIHKVGIHLGRGVEIPEEYKLKGAKLEIKYKPAFEE